MIALQIKVKKKTATKLNRKLTIGKKWKKRAPDKLSINEEEIKKKKSGRADRKKRQIESIMERSKEEMAKKILLEKNKRQTMSWIHVKANNN